MSFAAPAMRLTERSLNSMKAPDNFVRGFLLAVAAGNFWHKWHTNLRQFFPVARAPCVSDLQKTLYFQWFYEFLNVGIAQAKDVLS
jgi:hypothetical protein